MQAAGKSGLSVGYYALGLQADVFDVYAVPSSDTRASNEDYVTRVCK